MLALRGICVAFEGQDVLHGVDLAVAQGEIVCLLGASGSGKTTLLRVIAGLQMPDTGDVLVDGRSILRTPVHRRGFGLMFQDFALFPHMNVEQNVRFGLRMARVPYGLQQARVREVVALVGLSGFESRDVASLSGGEKQRVALARSLAPAPRLLMLDEPLGALDAALRDHLVSELRAIIKQVGLTAIYVTHDQQEAFAIADRIAVMHAGRIAQVDTPQALYRAPRTTFVARFLGLTNILPVLSRDGSVARTALGAFAVTTGAEALLIHPDGLQLTNTETPGALQGCVTEMIFRGDDYVMNISVLEDITLTLKHPSASGYCPQVGDRVFVVPKQDRVVALRDDASSW